MKPKQKLGLGVFLTLNVWMIVISLLRTSLTEIATPQGKMFDTVWCMFWIFVEAFVAIFVASLAAVRFIFARQRPRDLRRGAAATPSSFMRNAMLRRQQPDGAESLDSLTDIPPARLRSGVVEWAPDGMGRHDGTKEETESTMQFV